MKNYSDTHSYGKYFLVIEEDETTEESQPKNRKNINLGSDISGRRTDFTKTNNNEDDTSLNDNIENQNQQDENVSNTIDNNETQEVNNDEQTSTDSSNSINDNTDDNEDDFQTDEPDTGDDTDFTDTGDETDSNSEDSSSSSDSSDNESENKGPGLEYDSMRKYSLFLEFESFVNAINNYITKLENINYNDINKNKLSKIVVTKLREVKDMCSDYMTMKFEISTYIQSLIFYQNSIITVKQIFKLMNTMNNHNKK